MIDSFDVLIVGAGAAGLAAGRALAATGKRTAILEARDRVGGRIFTRWLRSAESDVPVELGAEFVHGLPQSTWNLLEEGDFDTYELGGEQLCLEPNGLVPCGHHFKDAFEILESLPGWLARQPPGTDLSFADYLVRERIGGAAAERAIRYVEGFNASDYTRIGVAALARQQRAEDAIDADRIFHVTAGYGALPQYLQHQFVQSGGAIFLGHEVTRIAWRAGFVELDARQGQNLRHFVAQKVVVTAPLGVLQSGAIDIAPRFQFEEALEQLAMGPVLRASLLFRQRPWSDAAPDLSFLHSPGLLVPTWWTSHPNPVPMVTAWMAGARAMNLAAPMLAEGREAFIAALLENLARACDVPMKVLRDGLISVQFHDWQSDPFSRGAYSYAPAGALDASRHLAAPVENTFFLAGEHTDIDGHWGTVHAALASGQRAAQQIIVSD